MIRRGGWPRRCTTWGMLHPRYAPRALHLFFVVFAVALLVGTIVEKVKLREQAPPAPAASVTVVDVARGVDARALASLVKLQADERVVAVEDRPVANDLAAGAAIAERALGPGRFLDLTVAGARGQRRVLVLMH